MTFTAQHETEAALKYEVYGQIQAGVAEGIQKKILYQQIARDAFLRFFSREDNLTTDGKKVCDAVFSGGLSAAREVGWPEKKAARHLSLGLLEGIGQSGGHFFSGGSTVVRSAILCALLDKHDFYAVAEAVVGAVMEAGRHKDCNLEELARRVSHAAVDAANSFPSENIAPMEHLLMGLLSGRVHLEGDEGRLQ